MTPSSNPAAFREALADWFSEVGKPHPWRFTTDPWAILVSELMLQQTTVASVLANRRFEKFLAEFPTPSALASASETTILRAWEGLGYYNRVRNLQKTARDLDGKPFPRDPAELLKLPGLGPYTAHAVASFAFDLPVPLVDGNIARVLARLFDDPTPIDSTVGKNLLWQRATSLLPENTSRLHNSALMELGQTVCSPRAPRCASCPVAGFCAASDPETLPRKKLRPVFTEKTENALLVRRGAEILLARETGSRRQGLFRLPLRDADAVAHLEPAGRSRYVITRYRVTLRLFKIPLAALPGGILPGESFHSLATLEALPVATPVRKILREEFGGEASSLLSEPVGKEVGPDSVPGKLV